MADHNVALELIEDFLAQKHIAIVGVSRDPKHFSVALFTEFCRRGYTVAPVNPNAEEIQGRRCFHRVQEIQPPPDAVLLMTPHSETEAVVRDCDEAGVSRVWMYRAGGKGAVSPEAIEFCRAKGIEVIPGQCPFMFWKGTEGVHRFHGFIRKITGRYPRHTHNPAA